MSGQKCRDASNFSGCLRKQNRFPGPGGADDGCHCSHGGDAILDPGARARNAMQDSVCECLDLQLVGVGVFTQRAAKLTIFYREAFHVARLVKPGQKHLSGHAAVFTIDLKPLFEVAANRNGEVEMTEAAVREVDAHKPAVSPEALQQPGANACYFAAEKAGIVHKVTSMCQHEVTALVRLGVSLRPACLTAGLDDGLEVIRHRVTVGGVIVPGFEPHPLTEFVSDKVPCEPDAGVETSIVADLKDQLALAQI